MKTISSLTRGIDLVEKMLEPTLSRLILMTGCSEQKSYTLASVFEEKALFIDIGKYLSSQLLNKPQGARALKAKELLDVKAAQGPVFFFNIEILFDKGMDLDVLPALKSLARGRTIYVDWPGLWNKADNKVIFAEEGDPAYYFYPVDPSFGIVDLTGDSSPSVIS